MRLLTFVAAVALLFAADWPAAPTAAQSPPVQASAPALRPYAVRLGRAPALLVADAPVAELNARARAKERAALAEVLARLRAAGEAGPASFDEVSASFRVDLADAAVSQLQSNPLVDQVTPGAPADAGPNGVNRAGALAALHPNSSGSVSSVDFVQVYSPFMWGRTNVGGLTVQLTLLDSTGAIVVGVPSQTVQPAPNNTIVVDRTQLYYETVFVDPNNPSHPPVMIVPGERVHVVTSGVDPTTQQEATEDKTIVVDDVQAWTSYQNGTVGGTTSLTNAPVVITVASQFLSISSYLTPGSSVTYAAVTADASGSFSAASFRTSTNATYSKVTLQQGSTGFVRVQHPNGDEVYTIHGQNVLPLEHASVLNGWTFSLPGSPYPLDSGVTVSHPSPTVAVTLANAQGGTLDAKPLISGLTPYHVTFNQPVQGGDLVQVTINGAYIISVATAPITATVDLSANQVVGTGPPNTVLSIGIGQVDGYITTYSSVRFVPVQATSNGSGSYSSGAVFCGSGALAFQPGSFGYVGYEDSRGNFTYLDFAAPRTDVLVNTPFAEGWVADGLVQPTLTVDDVTGARKFQVSPPPQMLWLNNPGLFIDVYWNLPPAPALQFFNPGDQVGVSEGTQSWTIPVDALTGYVNTDADQVGGQAPPGTSVLVVPDQDRTASARTLTNSAGAYSVANPFQGYNDSTCSVAPRTEAFAPGANGRVYLQHGDGNSVFAFWGRAMHVNENENVVDLYLFPTWNISWASYTATFVPPITATLTITPTVGVSSTVQSTLTTQSFTGDTQMHLVNAQNQRVLIRSGANLAVIFPEGPPAGPQRGASLGLTGVPLITGSPDLSVNTVAGVGPPAWTGQATLNAPPYANPVPLPARPITPYGPLQFVSNNQPVALVQGYSGVISYSDLAGHRVWSAWAATAFPVTITSHPLQGDTTVCGTAPANSPVNLHDVTVQPNDVIIGTGSSDGNQNFCVTVSPPLFKGQVILAESGGTYSQPVVVGIAASGVSSFIGGNSATSNFNLPLVRTDANYDTVIHLANATASATTATITFANPDGSFNDAVSLPLAPWATVDYDAGQYLGTAFVGSATVVASPTSVAVAVDVIDGDQASDNVDSYAGVAGSVATLWVPLAMNGSPYLSTLYLQNPTANPAAATATFYQNGAALAVAGASWTVPAGGSVAVDLSTLPSLPAGWTGPVQIQSSQPLAVVSALAGGGVFATAAAAAPATTFEVPRFANGVANPGSPGGSESTAIVLLNTAASQASFAVSYYDAAGNLLKQLTSPPVPAQTTWTVGPALGGTDPGLPPGAAYSAVATDLTSGGAATAAVVKVFGSAASPTGLTTFAPPAAPLPGTYAYAPALRKNANGNQSTILTALNSRTVPQNYQVAYADQLGSAAETASVCLNPNEASTFGQGTDPGLPAGFAGSAQIRNLSFQVLPIVVAELYAGSFVPPPVTPASAVCPAPATPTSTPSPTPRPTSTATSTTTGSDPPSATVFNWQIFLPSVEASATLGW